MRAFFKLNGTDFSKWIAADGLVYGEDKRRETTVDTADGTRRTAAIYKATLQVTFRSKMPERVVNQMVSICRSHIVSASYALGGVATTRTMIVDSLTYTASEVIGQDTVYSGVSLSLIER